MSKQDIWSFEGKKMGVVCVCVCVCVCGGGGGSGETECAIKQLKY